MSACPNPIAILRLCEKCSKAVMGPYARFCLEHACEKRKRPRKYVPDEARDAVIRGAYVKLRKNCDRGALGLAAKITGYPRWQVKARARALGLVRTKEAPWSEEEVAILERWGWMSEEALRLKLRDRGFQRSLSGILNKRKRMVVQGNGDWYSACGLAGMFGVDESKVRRWIKSGMIRADRRGTQRTSRQGGDEWLVRRAAVKAFVLAYPNEYDLGKVEKWWFLDLITDGKVSR